MARLWRHPADGRLTIVLATPLRAAHDATVDWTLEVVVVPVSDLDRPVAFYRDQVGFVLDHDT